MIYLEYLVESEKLSLKFSNSIYTDDELYQESVGSFFRKLSNSLHDYIRDQQELHKLYKDKSNLERDMYYLSKLVRRTKLGDQTVRVRGYNGKVESNVLSDEIKSLKNLLTYSNLKLSDPVVSSYLEGYEANKNYWDVFYKVPIKEVPIFYKTVMKDLDNRIEELKTLVKDLPSYFEKASDEKPETKKEKENIFLKIITKLSEVIKKELNICMMNIEAIKYQIVEMFSKLTEEEAEKLVMKDVKTKDIMDASKFVKEITYGDNAYKIYETEYKNVSAMNYGGNLIYVNNGFFDMPKGYQLAVLYHEIGHNECKHFKPASIKKMRTINKDVDIPLEDTSELVKRLYKDLNKFYMKVSQSPYRNSEHYNNGEEFIYLLIEWEADRFAAMQVGKNLVRKSLSDRFKEFLIANSKDVKEKNKKDYIGYNLDRMRIRTSLI